MDQNSALVKEQPYIQLSENTSGPKYRVIMFIKCNKSTLLLYASLDTGVYTNTIHISAVKRLNREMWSIPLQKARSASGLITISKLVKLNINFGAVSYDAVFSVIESDGYKSDLILLCSSIIEELDLMIKFRDRTMLVKGIHPIKIYDSEREVIRKMKEIKRDYATAKCVDLTLSRGVIVKAAGQLKLEISLKPCQASTLVSLASFGRSNRLPTGLIATDILIEQDFDCRAAPTVPRARGRKQTNTNPTPLTTCTYLMSREGSCQLIFLVIWGKKKG